MKKLLLAAAAIFAFSSLAISSTANAAEQGSFPYWYIGLSGGVTGQASSNFKTGGTKTSVDWDAGSLVTASLGYQPPELGGFRVEAEYSNHNQDISGSSTSGKVNANGGALNVYYDFFNSSVLTPYIGGGVGYSNFDLRGYKSSASATRGGSTSDDSFIYQGMIGVAWEPNSIPDVAFDLGYRYFAPFKEIKDDDGTKYDYDNNSVEVGARFRF